MSIDGLSSSQRRYMLVEGARARCEEASDRSMRAMEAMEGLQNMMGMILGTLGQLLKGVFSKGGMKGGGGKGF